MEIRHNHFACNWCGTTFDRRVICGRKPHYCGPTCRQRAYEARRRAAHQHALPARVDSPRRSPPPIRYEGGVTRWHSHALRRTGPVDLSGRRTTLCGASARTSRIPFFDQHDKLWPACRTCCRLADQFPPDRQIDPPVELAHVGNLVESLRWAQAHAPDHVLRAEVGTLLARFT